MKVQFKPGPAKLQAVKAIKNVLNRSLKEAKDCVDNGVFECSEEQYPSVKKTLVEWSGSSDFKIIE